MYETKTFEHDGKTYEVRIASNGQKIFVRVFKDGEAANGYEYTVELPVQIDAKASGSSIDPVKELMETAINDVKNGIWEQYVKAVMAHQSGAPGA